MHQSRKEGQKSLLIGLISFSLVGSPSLYHATIFTATKPGCCRYFFCAAGIIRGDKTRVGMEVRGEGGGYIGKEKEPSPFS